MNHVCRVIHADEIHRKGIKGRGVTATVMDSGICGHPDYADRVVCFRDFVGHRSGFYDDASHGSHVTGILGGKRRSVRRKILRRCAGVRPDSPEGAER